MKHLRIFIFATVLASGIAVACLAWLFVDRPEAKLDAWKARPDATLLYSQQLSRDTDWTQMVAMHGSAAVVGMERNAGATVAMTILALSPSGTVRGQLRTSNIDGCTRTKAMVPVGVDSAVLLCATEREHRWLAVTFEGERPSVKVLPQPEPEVAYFPRGSVSSAAKDSRHFWLIQAGENKWFLGTGDGVSSPQFVAFRPTSEFVAIAAYSETEVLLVTGGPRIELSIVTREGRTVRSVVVAQGTHGADEYAPRVFFDGKEIAVAWVQRSEHFTLSSLGKESRLAIRRFSSALEPIGTASIVSDDRYVAPFEIYPFGRGGALGWEQGRRAPWHVASFLHFDSIAQISRQRSLRLPFGALPKSIVKTERGLLILTSDDKSAEPADRIILLDA